jgi:hypothetical protein
MPVLTAASLFNSLLQCKIPGRKTEQAMLERTLFRGRLTDATYLYENSDHTAGLQLDLTDSGARAVCRIDQCRGVGHVVWYACTEYLKLQFVEKPGYHSFVRYLQ